MLCRLCQKESKLSKSHIIPEYFYFEMYGKEIRRFQELDLEKHKFAKPPQQGIYEKLLCKKCEGLFNKYETQFRNIIYGTKKHKLDINGWKYRYKFDKKYLLLSQDLSYLSLRYFQLSVLWRAGISTHPLFDQVKLGKYEHVLREMLLENNLHNNRIQCYMFALEMNGNPLLEIIPEVISHRIKKYRVYRFIFGGIVWLFFICGQGISGPIMQTINIQKETYQLSIREFSDFKGIDNLVKNISDIIERSGWRIEY